MKDKTVTSRPYLGALTGIRAIAAHMVFFHHLGGEMPFKLAHLYTGVGIFFVLSGFLITYHNYDAVVNGQFSVGKYFIRRFGRIYPAYLAVFMITAYLVIVPEQDGWPYWILNLTLLKSWTNKYIYSGVGQSWTLGIEETFYALAPIIFFLVGRKHVWLPVLAAVSIGLGMIQWYLAFLMPWNPHFTRDIYSLSMTGFFFMFLPFVSGIWGALVLTGKRQMWFRPKHLTYLGLAMVIGSIWGLELAKPVDSPFWQYSHWQSGIVLVGLPFSVSLLLIGLASERSLLARFLASPPMDLLGRTSYLVYLLHTGVIATAIMAFIEERAGSWKTPLFILAINLVAYLGYTLFEEPMSRLIRRFASQQNQNRPAEEQGQR